MFLSASPGLGSISGVVHLAVRRPYILALAVTVFAAVAFTNSISSSIPALSPPSVPAAPIVQHTRRPAATPGEHVASHAFSHQQKGGAKRQLTVKQRSAV